MKKISAAACLLGALVLGLVDVRASAAEAPAKRPNIVWIVAEDMGPHMGCYGDKQAITPNLDRLAAESARFTHAFTHAPVCAPSRSGFITGMYPTTIGTHHMRSKLKEPPRLFTSYLIDAGYHVAWPGKTDFNFDVPKNSFSSTKDWTKPGDKLPQPFFAYHNIGLTHESQIRAKPAAFARNTGPLKPAERQDPAKLVLPPYYPDEPEVRRDVANYYELVTALDYRVGEILAELEQRGVADNTVVVFFGDHGWGMPRGKRWVYDSGIRVPLVIRWPGKLEAGSTREELVSFIDFAPTMLAIAGAEVPAQMQGQDFLGDGAERQYVFAARDRMDETYDRIRAVRNKRYKYIRNFEPKLPYAQRVQYGELMPTMQSWRKLAAMHKLQGPQQLFFAAGKPQEELYDLETDPHEINNLAEATQHQAQLKELSSVLDRWLEETKDLGAVPERELVERGLVEDVLGSYAARKVAP